MKHKITIVSDSGLTSYIILELAEMVINEGCVTVDPEPLSIFFSEMIGGLTERHDGLTWLMGHVPCDDEVDRRNIEYWREIAGSCRLIADRIEEQLSRVDKGESDGRS